MGGLKRRVRESIQMNLPRLLVIFDLDETLVRATYDAALAAPDFMLGEERVCRRPLLESSLRAVVEFAEIAVWSSASDRYVGEMVRRIVPEEVPMQFVWARSRCTRRYDTEQFEEYWVKDLKKVKRLGYPLEQVVIVDDSPEKIERHYGNHVRIEPFYGDPEDRMLPRLATYLRQPRRSRMCVRWRSVGGHGWRARSANKTIAAAYGQVE